MQLEQRGIATATIVTSAFRNAADAHRKLLKAPELTYFVVPHPIVSMSEEALSSSADAIAADILAFIHGTAPAVSADPARD